MREFWRVGALAQIGLNDRRRALTLGPGLDMMAKTMQGALLARGIGKGERGLEDIKQRARGRRRKGRHIPEHVARGIEAIAASLIIVAKNGRTAGIKASPVKISDCHHDISTALLWQRLSGQGMHNISTRTIYDVIEPLGDLVIAEAGEVLARGFERVNDKVRKLFGRGLERHIAL